MKALLLLFLLPGVLAITETRDVHGGTITYTYPSSVLPNTPFDITIDITVAPPAIIGSFNSNLAVDLCAGQEQSCQTTLSINGLDSVGKYDFLLVITDPDNDEEDGTPARAQKPFYFQKTLPKHQGGTLSKPIKSKKLVFPLFFSY